MERKLFYISQTAHFSVPGWVNYKPEADKIIQSLHTVGRDLLAWARITASQELHWQKAAVQNWNLKLSLRIVTQDMDILITRLNFHSSVYLFYKLAN